MKRSIVKCNINFLWRRHFSICSRLLDRKSYIGVAQTQPEAGARPMYIPLGAKSWWTQSREWGSLRWTRGMWVVGGIPHPTDPQTVCDVCQEPRYVWDWVGVFKIKILVKRSAHSFKVFHILWSMCCWFLCWHSFLSGLCWELIYLSTELSIEAGTDLFLLKHY